MRRTLSARALRTGLAVFVLASLAAGCGVLTRVPRVPMVIQEGGIVYARVGDAAKLVGGETILSVSNDSESERHMVLAHLPEGWTGQVPADLLAAESVRDDPRILGMTNPLEPRRLEAGGAGFAFIRASHTFHVYLRPGETYLLFDRLGGVADGIVKDFVPTDEGARS